MSGPKYSDCYELPIPEEVHDERYETYGFKTPGVSRGEVIRRNTVTLARCLHYEFKDIAHLESALCVDVVGDNPGGTHLNSGLATVGEAVIKTVIADELFIVNHSWEETVILREALENNNHLHRATRRLGVGHYAYTSKYLFDEAPSGERLPFSKRDNYLEAIAGAVFYDLGFDACRDWIKREILPRLFQ